MFPRLRRAGAILLVAALTAGGLNACAESIPSPDTAAKALAKGLASGSINDVPLTDANTAPDIGKVFAGLGKAKRSTTVKQVDRGQQDDQGRHTAIVHTDFAIDLSPLGVKHVWKYATTTRMVYDGAAGQWKAELTPESLAPELKQGQRLNVKILPAQRGQILDIQGKSLTTLTPVHVVEVDTAKLKENQWQASAEQLAQVLQVDTDAIMRQLRAAPRTQVPVHLARKTDLDRARVQNIPGVRVREEKIQLSRDPAYAGGLVGRVNYPAPAAEKDKKAAKTQPGPLRPAGVSGLQLSNDAYLAGTPGVTIQRVNTQGKTQGSLYSVPAVNGKTLHSTFHPKLQAAAEKVLSGTAHPSAIVAIRPSDGAVLAVASGPAGHNSAFGLYHLYPPGSTFKVASALAMLRSGLKPSSPVQCTSETFVNGQRFTNYKYYPPEFVGTIPLRTALAESCNTVFAHAAHRVNAQQLHDAAASLGLRESVETGMPEVVLGKVPTDAENNLLATNLFGQGTVEASVLGMATVAASVKKAGTVTPTFTLDQGLRPAPKPPTQPLTAAEAKDLQLMMQQVVSNGTLADQFSGMPGPVAGGKTGTAEFVTGGEDQAHTWVIAYQGDLAIAVFVEIGLGGAVTSGPLARNFLTEARTIIK